MRNASMNSKPTFVRWKRARRRCPVCGKRRPRQIGNKPWKRKHLAEHGVMIVTRVQRKYRNLD